MADEERRSAARQARERLARWLDSPQPDGALDALADLALLRRALEVAELSAVQAARAAGRSWAEIATMLGVTRQSAWEKWRDLDEGRRNDPPDPAEAAVVSAAAALARRRGRVRVPDVLGLDWRGANAVLGAAGLVAVAAESDPPPEDTVTLQSPEAGAKVAAGSAIRLWFGRDGGRGVREPRRPQPDPREARAMRDEFSDDTVG